MSNDRLQLCLQRHYASVNVQISMPYSLKPRHKVDHIQRPDIQAPFFNMTLHDDRHVTPGYILITPYQTNQDSIYMYDNRGVSTRVLSSMRVRSC